MFQNIRFIDVPKHYIQPTPQKLTSTHTFLIQKLTSTLLKLNVVHTSIYNNIQHKQTPTKS